MKIALLTDGLYPDSIGGIQKHSHLLVKYFSKNNVYVDNLSGVSISSSCSLSN